MFHDYDILIFMMQEHILIARVCTVGVKGSGSLARSLPWVPTFRIPSFPLGALKCHKKNPAPFNLGAIERSEATFELEIRTRIGDKGFGRRD